MSESLNVDDPQYWRARARQLRSLIDDMPQPETKKRLLDLALEYDELAIRAEQRLAGIRPKPDEQGEAKEE